jgi:predicted acyl esterase
MRWRRKFSPGTVVKLEIGIWAMGVEYEAGEGLQVRVSGRNMAVNSFGTAEHNDNRGMHRVHVGGEYPSSVVLPFCACIVLRSLGETLFKTLYIHA